jgi:enamine deaminase RidA (YjgF/YER057c/UK114 family)
MVYLADMSRKGELNQAWDEWVDLTNPPQRACLGVALEGADLVEIVVTAAV